MTNDITPLTWTIDEAGPTAGVVVARLEQAGSPVVVLDHPLIRRLEMTLNALPGAMTGFVLASASTRVFVAGADLKTIQANPEDPDSDRKLDAYLSHGQRVFGMIADLPCPTVAAINGAALGGGLELAMHCDGLAAAPSASGKPYPVGLPEAGLGICPGWGGTNLWPARIDPLEAIRRTALGKPMVFDEAVKAGMFDAVAASEAELIPAAKAWVVAARATMGRPGEIPPRDGAPSRWIGRPGVKATVLSAMAKLAEEKLDGEAARAVLDGVRAGLDEGWAAALELERTELTRLRNTPAGRAAIQAFFDKAKK